MGDAYQPLNVEAPPEEAMHVVRLQGGAVDMEESGASVILEGLRGRDDNGSSSYNSTTRRRPCPILVRLMACLLAAPVAMVAAIFTLPWWGFAWDDPRTMNGTFLERLAPFFFVALYFAMLAGLYSLVWCLGSVAYTGQPSTPPCFNRETLCMTPRHYFRNLFNRSEQS